MIEIIGIEITYDSGIEHHRFIVCDDEHPKHIDIVNHILPAKLSKNEAIKHIASVKGIPKQKIRLRSDIEHTINIWKGRRNA